MGGVVAREVNLSGCPVAEERRASPQCRFVAVRSHCAKRLERGASKPNSAAVRS